MAYTYNTLNINFILSILSSDLILKKIKSEMKRQQGGDTDMKIKYVRAIVSEN